MFRILPIVVLLPAGAFAGPVTINFASSLINRQAGQTATFSANLINTTGGTVFLNGDSLNIAAPLTGDDTKFFFNFPLTLAPGASSGSFQIFDITIPLGATLGSYSGAFSILGGATGADLDPLGTAVFAVNVVPEPATGTLLHIAMCAGAALRRRRSQARTAALPGTL